MVTRRERIKLRYLGGQYQAGGNEPRKGRSIAKSGTVIYAQRTSLTGFGLTEDRTLWGKSPFSGNSGVTLNTKPTPDLPITSVLVTPGGFFPVG